MAYETETNKKKFAAYNWENEGNNSPEFIKV